MKSAHPANRSKLSDLSLINPTSSLPIYRVIRVLSLLLLVGLLIGGSYFTSSASFSSKVAKSPDPALSSPGKSAGAIPSNFLPAAKSTGIAPWSSLFTAPVPQSSPEDIATYASDCETPKTSFVVGDTVCVRVTGVDVVPFFPRTLTWAVANSTIVKSTDITSSSQTDTYQTVPFVVGVTEDNRGTWQVSVRNPFFYYPEVRTTFLVTDPVNPTADIAVASTSAPESVSAGSQVEFGLQVNNYGPDSSTNVQLSDAVPANTTFVSFVQTSGPTFNCSNPESGTTGTTTCTAESLAKDDIATFVATYTVNPATPTGTVLTNVANVASQTVGTTPATADENDRNNSTSQGTNVSGQTGGTCELNCPDNINAIADTTEGGQRGKHVTFDAAEPTGTCGAITAAPASGSFFPVGTTTVTVTSETNGGSCSFTITVEDQGGVNPPTISCPPNPPAANANADCEANVNIGSPTVTGNNVTFSGVRSDGRPMYNCDCFPPDPLDPSVACDIHGACTRRADAPFQSGITTITWTAYSHDTAGPYATPEDEVSHRTGNASCTETVTVYDVTPPVITAVDSTVSADANCQAPVPDYSNDVNDNCSCSSSDDSEDCRGKQRITLTQSPAAGTMVGKGPHTIHLVANDHASNPGPDGIPDTSDDGTGNTTEKDVTFTVRDTTAPVITCPAPITTNTEPGTCAAHVNPGTATATDNCDTTPTITASRSDGRPITDTYPKGTTTITWTATDDDGNHSSCTQTITVVDNEPPVIVFNGQTPSMWPPNHKYQTFQVTNFVTSVTDNCDSINVSSVVITKVTSDELENSGGDGNTLNDIVIAANCKSIQLRSERDGGGNGRVYTIFFSVRDASNNVGTGTARVVVPHNPGETAVDSGPHYTVMSSCP